MCIRNLLGSCPQFCLVLVLTTGCAIKAELTLERTALENQIMGSYQQIDDELLMVSLVESKSSGGKIEPSDAEKEAQIARRNRQYNADDIVELKDEQILGETKDGFLQILPEGQGLRAEASAARVKLAEILVHEENSDRDRIWKREITSRPDLTAESLEKIKSEFIDAQQRVAKIGHWFQDRNGNWKQKITP